MADFKLESWEREPLWLKLITPFLKKKRFPELPEKPETGKWYRIYPEGCVAANGERTHANFFLGTENHLLVFFQGGGVSWNEYTAARPASLYSKNMAEGFYMIHVDLFSDLSLNKGILEDSERNSFRGWSKLVLPYNTGDFHSGCGDFPYTALDGSRRILHHHGYRNYRKVMETVTQFVTAPDRLLISGCSGGGFGTALLADDLIGLYPNCGNVVTLVDSGFLLLKNWDSVAKDVWQAPKEIADRIHSDNITLDALTALHEKRGERVKILFSCSVRDAALARMQYYIDHGNFSFSKEAGMVAQKNLQQMCDALRKYIPGVGLFVFDTPDKQHAKEVLTIHCIIGDKTVYEYSVEGTTAMEWIKQATSGNIQQIGLDLLKE
ncbi:MAG TPA: pectinacetylesterase family protein [Sellimonas intestinalis]|nr:pectinacetylesterase family protein [Sellimonas intestinalis]